MDLKPGDKVSFLNEKRDGIVKKMLNNKMVLVEIEDGFDIPVAINDLVKADAYTEIVAEINSGKQAIEEEAEERFPLRIPVMAGNSDEEKTKKGIYLAFIPENAEDVLSAGFGIYLINHNSHDLLFTYSLKEQDKFICKDFDRIDEETAILLDVIDKTDLEKWQDSRFHFLSFKKDAAIEIAPIVHEIHLRPVRFYKEENYLFHRFIVEKCLLFSLSEKEQIQQPEAWTDDKWKNDKLPKPSGLKIVGHINDLNKPEAFPEKHIIEKGVAEVDLHIEELIDNYSGRDNFELLTIQMTYFNKMIESAIANKFRRIIFIHGVGNGKLKSEIINRLKERYPDLNYADASMLKYGHGATEIELV